MRLAKEGQDSPMLSDATVRQMLLAETAVILSNDEPHADEHLTLLITPFLETLPFLGFKEAMRSAFPPSPTPAPSQSPLLVLPPLLLLRHWRTPGLRPGTVSLLHLHYLASW